MAESLVSLAVALQAGQLKSLDTRADQYATGLIGVLYGETRLGALLARAATPCWAFTAR